MSKKTPKTPARKQSQSQQSDEDLNLLSASTMDVLQGFIEDEIERDIDPDFVPETQASSDDPDEPDYQEPTTSRALKLVTVDKEKEKDGGKGRSSNPIWNYFNVSDRKVGGRIEKGAICKVEISGVPCGKRIMQNGSTTSGLNQHLERKHPKAFEECKKSQATLQAEKLGTKRTLQDHFDSLEGTPTKKPRMDTPLKPSSALKPLPRTPWDRVLKYDTRGKMQLRFDLWITEYWVRLGLPWTLLDHPAHKEFWSKENPKYHCKHSTTFSRAKLPLLYDQVKHAVEVKVKKDVLHTGGVAFTADHWSSSAMDPYIGVTMHMIGKNWTLER